MSECGILEFLWFIYIPDSYYGSILRNKIFYYAAFLAVFLLTSNVSVAKRSSDLMQDQKLQNILMRIDSVRTELAQKDAVRCHTYLQPAVELFQILENTSYTYVDDVTVDY